MNFTGIYYKESFLIKYKNLNKEYEKKFLKIKELKEGIQFFQIEEEFWGIFLEKNTLIFIIVISIQNEELLSNNINYLRNNFYNKKFDWKNTNLNNIQEEFNDFLNILNQKINRELKQSNIIYNLNEISNTSKESYKEVLLRGKNLNESENLSNQL